MWLRRVGAAHHPVVERLEPAHYRILIEKHDVGAGNDGSFALVGVDHAGEAFEQGCLAGAIAADQGEAVARTDVDVEVAEQPALALDQSEVFVGEGRGGHQRASSESWLLRNATV